MMPSIIILSCGQFIRLDTFIDLINLTYAEANTSLSMSSSVYRPLTEIFSRDCIIEPFFLGLCIYIFSYRTLLTGVMPVQKDTTGPVLWCVVRCPLKLSTLHKSLLSMKKVSHFRLYNSVISELLRYTSFLLPCLAI